LHIAVLAYFYAAEYFFRFLKIREKRFISLGKAIGRLVLAITYTLIYVLEPAEAQRVVWVRWSLFLFLIIDLFYIAQEHIMKKIFAHGS
jgi:hypothetical protein